MGSLASGHAEQEQRQESDPARAGSAGEAEEAGEAAEAAVPAGERGATRVEDRVIAKIASQAAREALLGAPGTDAAHAAVVVRGDTARVRVGVHLGFPSDLGGQCRAVCRAVTERVEALVGLEVPEVAVEVERLHTTERPNAPRGRVR
ncbi:hypothetical protein [Streptomyces sp. MAR4 CNX-425]|uniref:hypothetical protein n=1 Tax=Streptomyces sp. MAR4 CNX-425 TaxID=3406343 RepID=UPI003B511218